ncbi:MAG: restriction endonuclease subunit S, partial [Candidatus Pacebacteria bacterium]|nr:restriction endonuclease subunit S [Candidatus Paceibacterota bacterium]
LPNDLFDKGGALDVLRAQSIAIQTGNKNTLVNDKSLFAWVVEKEEIAESGDCNLTGDKYKRDLYVRLQSITQNLEKIFKPYKETLKQIQKQTEPYRKLTEQLQKQAEQVSRVFASLMFQEAQKSIQKVVEQMQKAFKNVDFQQIIKQQKKLQEELKKRQKWGMVKLEEILEYEQPTKYIVESVNYNDSFKTPVLTAGKTFILGYTNEREGIMPANKLPVIIFDDFTTAIKFVDFPFKVKSSAMKILHIDQKKADPRFLFQLMKTIKFRHDDHKRYWISEFSKIKIPLPPFEVQKEIAEQIEVKQNAINHAKEIIKNLERERRYFSQEIGKLEDIELVELGEVCEIQSGGTPKRNEKKYWNGYIPWLGSAVCKDKKVYEAKEFITEEGLNNSSTRLFKINTTLLALVGATIGKTALLKLEASTNQNIAGLYPKNENQLDPIYLFLAVQSQYQKFLDLGDGKF